MKRPSNEENLDEEDKFRLLVKNGYLLKDKFTKKSKPECKADFDVVKSGLMSKSGRIKVKKKVHLKFLDNILKSELKIQDSQPKIQKPKEKTSKTSISTVINNNESGLSNQNKKPNKESKGSVKKKHKKKASKTEDRQTECLERELGLSWMAKQCLTYSTNPKRRVFQCDYCKKFFINKTSMRRHIYVHLKVIPYACKYCYKRFYMKENMMTHMKLQHSRGMKIANHYICAVCEEPFLLKEKLDEHMMIHVKNEKLIKCIFCNKQFPHPILLHEHEKEHLITGKYKCTVCEMSYDSRSNLALHIKGHLKLKDYICQHCGKEFLRLTSLRRHVQICHAGILIQCPICKKKLKGHLTEHLRTHEKKRPHKCPECGQRFTQSTQLNVHRRCHTGDRPYPCRICDRPFTHSNALMLHIRRHTGEKPFKCAMCPLYFSQLPHMKAHMRNIHGNNLPYKCEKCSQFFKLKAHLATHAKTCMLDGTEQTPVQDDDSIPKYDIEVESIMSLSRMRFLLALLFTMIASKEKLKYLGFNKRLIDDLLIESLEAMGHTPCRDESLSPLKRLRNNIDTLLKGTVPKEKMDKFEKENKTTEELLELLTNEKKVH
ncbi:PREDICTED: zinc finger protein 25-like isoform X2 [Papilio polytes]|nr:PREDICTED: zinc finger protein 25-like isoform X2 [Papilio polytes]XP_013140199.1 PREDICTED: zinc finger protein 25-like isoform X2 [Papilio polytes]